MRIKSLAGQAKAERSGKQLKMLQAESARRANKHNFPHTHWHTRTHIRAHSTHSFTRPFACKNCCCRVLRVALKIMREFRSARESMQRIFEHSEWLPAIELRESAL